MLVYRAAFAPLAFLLTARASATDRGMRLLACLALLALAACSHGSATSSTSAAIDPNAASMSVRNLTIERPEGWRFIAPDAAASRDTVLVLQGPSQGAERAPVVEIERRPLSLNDQREPPAALLQALVESILQTAEGFSVVEQPTDVQVAGKAARRLRLLLERNEETGVASTFGVLVYGIADGDQLWILRLVGPTDGSADAKLDEVLASLSL